MSGNRLASRLRGNNSSPRKSSAHKWYTYGMVKIMDHVSRVSVVGRPAVGEPSRGGRAESRTHKPRSGSTGFGEARASGGRVNENYRSRTRAASALTT